MLEMRTDITQVETVGCLCGSNAAASRSVVAHDEASGETFTYLVCPACSLERLSPRPTLGRIGSYYPASYLPHVGHAPKGRADRLKRLVHEVVWAPQDEVRSELRPWRPLLRVLFWPIRYRSVLAFTPLDARRVFEFGAARATDLLAFKAAGWQVDGCEPSEQACALALAQGIHLQNATAETAILASGAYTCILFNNVFEHIHDPVSVLRTCHRALQPGGVLMLIVPNHSSCTGRLFGAAWPGYDAPRHTWGWTPRSLRQQLAAAGFVIDYMHHQATGAWLWSSTLSMRHSPGRAGHVRRWLARNAAWAGIPFSVLAAWAGHGDFLRLVARKA